nr:MAG TPA: hypothetical protein [Bacteriophage sp.]
MTKENLAVSEIVLPIREYKGQRVVTFKDIDEVHQRKFGTARNNFYKNKSHFLENEDYFVITREDFNVANNHIGEIPPKGVTYLTESGYLMIFKTFKDELSWNVQRRLVNTYFRAREVAEIPQRPKVSSIPAPKPVTFYRKNRYKIAAICSSYGVEEEFLFELIFPYIEEKFDLEEAEIRYIMGTGKRLESKLDLFDFFPDMAERAKTVIDSIYESRVEHREEKNNGSKEA